MFIAILLLTTGAAFIVIASIGVARLPDVFQRMHSATRQGESGQVSCFSVFWRAERQVR
jgi:multicomponent Na+:H+ antiporter subunit G